MLYQPLDQFKISIVYNLAGITVANFQLYLIVSLLLVFIFFWLSLNFATIIPNYLQSFTEAIYKFVYLTFSSQLGTNINAARVYYPYIFLVFVFIFSSNLVGMVPFGFTVTSHIFVTFFLSFISFMGITILGFFINGVSFLKIFVPSNVPSFLVPFLVIIEIISYFSRVLSLAIRLFSNLTSGHTLLNILSSFCLILFRKHLLLSIIVFGIVTVVTVLELFIAVLQAYVFLVLLSIYLNDIYSVDSH